MMNVREWALPVYTILMQLASGAMFFLWVIRSTLCAKISKEKCDELNKIPLLIIFSTILVAMIGAHFHLSKPYLSFLAVTNFSRSWLSREIIFTVLLFLLTGTLTLLLWRVRGYSRLKDSLGWIAVLISWALIFCMARIYLLPTQIVWNTSETILLYYVQTVLLGAVSLSAMLLMDLNLSAGYKEKSVLDIQLPIVKQAFFGLTVIVLVTSLAILFMDLYRLYTLRGMEHPSVRASLSLLVGLYLPLFLMRFLLLILGISWLVASAFRVFRKNHPVNEALSTVYIASMFILVAEILERFLFYATHVRIGV